MSAVQHCLAGLSDEHISPGSFREFGGQGNIVDSNMVKQLPPQNHFVGVHSPYQQ
jgi:hypothetical protein